MRYALAVILSLFVCSQAQAFEVNCATIHWAMKHFSKEKLNEFAGQATPEQIATGRKCLAERAAAPVNAKHLVPAAKGQKTVKKGPQRVKKAHKLIVPVPRPAPLPKIEKVSEPLPLVKEAAPEQKTEQTTLEKPHMAGTFGFLEGFALFGVIAFTFCVLKFGFLPVITWIKARGAASAAAAAAGEARLAAIEHVLSQLANKASAGGTPVVPPPAASPPAA
jgi:hypothetical protein